MIFELSKCHIFAFFRLLEARSMFSFCCYLCCTVVLISYFWMYYSQSSFLSTSLMFRLFCVINFFALFLFLKIAIERMLKYSFNVFNVFKNFTSFFIVFSFFVLLLRILLFFADVFCCCCCSWFCWNVYILIRNFFETKSFLNDILLFCFIDVFVFLIIVK